MDFQKMIWIQLIWTIIKKNVLQQRIKLIATLVHNQRSLRVCNV